MYSNKLLNKNVMEQLAMVYFLDLSQWSTFTSVELTQLYYKKIIGYGSSNGLITNVPLIIFHD